MIKYITGDITEDPSECLVNTVNLEGFMGKGIAYQFKLKFPNNEKAYVSACRSKTIGIGTLFSFKEDDKLIINFPTKDKWRLPSQYEYIERGLIDLVYTISKFNIQSIAIPPLGCGNGGLEWRKVKELIEKYLEPISQNVTINIYEPSKYYVTKPGIAPKMNASHLILMRLKTKLDKFSKFRIQKAAFFVNLFSNSEYFRFEEHKFGPYSHSIDILSKQIKEFQDHFKVSTNEAEKIAYTRLVSESVEAKIHTYESHLLRSSSFINSFKSDLDLEIAATIIYILKNNNTLTIDSLLIEFRKWPKEDQSRFTDSAINKVITSLIRSRVIVQNLINIELNNLFFQDEKMPKYKEVLAD